MRVIGIIWTLYPLLGLLAFIEFIVGLAHVFFCLPYAHFYLTFWSGISAAITSVYALLLDFPNKCELLLQFVSVVFAFGLSLTSTAEAVCLRRIQMPGGQMSFCAGLLNRTATKQLQCQRVLVHFQSHILQAFTSAPIEQSLLSAQILVASIIALAAISQFGAGFVLFTFSARANHFRLTSAHWHAILGIALLALAVAHSHYCCPFFFAYLLPLAGIYSLIFVLAPVPSLGHPARQFLAIVGAALGFSLLTLAGFSVICWANIVPATSGPGQGPLLYSADGSRKQKAPTSQQLGFLRFCHHPERVYAHCERVLDFSFPYLDWPVEQVVQEKSIVRMCIHCLLALCSAAFSWLFMADAFCY